MKKRMAFSMNYHNWTENNWDTVMSSDKSTFRLINPRARKVRRPTAVSHYKQRYIVVNMKHSPNLRVWRGFSGNGCSGFLYFLPSKVTMNSER
jgi:hypothetical protein